jgi:hypothetical protein
MGEAVGEVPTNNSASILSKTQARTDNDYYETGLPPNLLGASTQTGDTATDSSQQLDNANKKIKFVIKNLAYTLFRPAFKYLLRLEQAYETDEYINKVTGRYLGWKIGSPARDAIQGDFDVQVNFSLNKQAQINKILLVMDRANQANQQTGQLVQMRVADPSKMTFIDTTKIFQEMLLPVIGIKKTDEFNLPSQPPPPEAEAPGGQPSQAGQTLDPTQAVANMSPMAPGIQR